MRNRILIAVNFNMDKKLTGYFEKEMGMPADVFFIDSIGKKSADALFRHYSYFMVALKTFFNRNKYHSIIFWQQFIGLYYGLISRLFFFLPTKSRSIVLTLIFVKREGFLGKMYLAFFRFMLNARSVTYAVCHSSIEKKYYQSVLKPKNNKIVFAEVGEGEPESFNPEYSDDIFFFSGGGSQRDYKTLIEAFRNSEYKLKIACFPVHIKNINIPDNVQIIHNAWHRAFDELIKKSYAIILSLKYPNISSGQLVLIKAMRMGRPAIVTAGDCLKNYADNSFSISVMDHSPDEITEAVKYMANNKDKRNELAKNAFELYNRKFSRDKYIKRICEFLKS